MVELKICLIGHYRNNPDEGVKNVAYNLYEEFSKCDDVIKCDVSDIIQSLPDIKKFNPDTIHFVVGPSSIIGFILSKFTSVMFPRSIVVMSAPQPTKFRFEWLIRFLKPDEIFVHSDKADERFRKYSCTTKFFPAGVDVDKFLPVSTLDKNKLRHKYEFEPDEFLILHVGHITKGRNLLVLSDLGDLGRILIVGSTTTRPDEETFNELKASGASIIIEFLPKIEEIYSIADCYVFPTSSEFNCIETPLSVLEAMSCNLPIVAMKFGALPKMFFEECKGLYFIDDEKDIRYLIKTIKSSNDVIYTRDCVMRYSWRNMASDLKKEYSMLIEEKRRH